MGNFKSWVLAVCLTTSAVFIGSVAEASPLLPTTLEQELFDLQEGQSNQLSNDAYWQLNAMSMGTASLIYADDDFVEFGIFDAADPNSTFALFGNNLGAGDMALFGMAGNGTVLGGSLGNGFGLSASPFEQNLFGFYLETVDGILYSDASLNSGAEDLSNTFAGTGSMSYIPGLVAGPWTPSEFMMSWGETLSTPKFGVMLAGISAAEYQTITAVPEPMTALLLVGGLIGTGVLRRKA